MDALAVVHQHYVRTYMLNKKSYSTSPLDKIEGTTRHILFRPCTVLKSVFIPVSLLFLSSRPWVYSLAGDHLLSGLPSFSVHRFCHLCPTVWTCFHPEVSSSTCHFFISSDCGVLWRNFLSFCVRVTWGPVTWGWPKVAPIYTVSLSQHRWLNVIGHKKAPPHSNMGTEPQLDLRSTRAQLGFRCPWTRVLGLELPAHLALLLPARTGLAYQLP